MFLSLDQISKIERGVRITKQDLTDKDNGYPVVSGGTGYMGFYPLYNRESNTITIAQYGTAGFVNFQTEKFWANDVCYSVFPNLEKINNKFLYYSLLKNQNEIYKKVIKGAPNHLPLKELKEISIWVPSLEVQERIVSMLDNLSSYTTDICFGLPTEIRLREQQLQYYLNRYCSPNFSNK